MIVSQSSSELIKKSEETPMVGASLAVMDNQMQYFWKQEDCFINENRSINAVHYGAKRYFFDGRVMDGK